jgi:hypothetical protein
MTFFLFASIAAALLVACDLVTGKITLGHLSGWPYTRRDDARSYDRGGVESADRRRIGSLGYSSFSCRAPLKS